MEGTGHVNALAALSPGPELQLSKSWKSQSFPEMVWTLPLAGNGKTVSRSGISSVDYKF